MADVDITDFKGLIFDEIIELEDEVKFITNDNERYKMFHAQDCCETVMLDEVIGDWQDLVGTPILDAQESSSDDRIDAEMNLYNDEEYVIEKLRKLGDDVEAHPFSDESETWTFYKLRTIKGSVTLRWYGASNGYYSERVDIVKEHRYMN